jgi:myo-inositol 2-dehydrogenase / D-chiro-inositol 1-dehydrogenase
VAEAGDAPLRLGIAGCGRIAERGYLVAAHGSSDVTFVAVADPDPARGRRAAGAAGGAAVFDATGEMIDRGGVEALVIATPAAQHEEVARLAARAGLPSLVEKPPSPDLAGANALTALDPAPAIGFNRRFLQGAELSPLVPADGWLELELEMCFRRSGWGAHLSRDEALLDAGTHLIDLAAFLTGSSPIAVRDATIEPERASLELELGRARARIRCAADRRYLERIEVRDRAGRPIVASRTSGPRARLRRLRGGEDPLVVSLRRQLARFAAAARGGDPGELAGAEAGAVVMSVIEAARRSADLGGAEVTVGRPTVGADAGAEVPA